MFAFAMNRRVAARALLGAWLAVAAMGAHALAPGSIAAADAASHIGQPATVCGVVASAKFASRSRGQPTFLDFDRPYPNQIFTAVIWSDNRPAFGTPEIDLVQKRICVSGLIESYRGRPEIILRDARQLTIQ